MAVSAAILKIFNVKEWPDKVPACDGRTDGQTDGQTDGRTDVKPIAITGFSIADARKNRDSYVSFKPNTGYGSYRCSVRN